MNKAALKEYLSSTTETYCGYRVASKVASVGTLVATANTGADSVGTLVSTSKIKNDSVGLLVASLNVALDSVGTKAGSTISSAALANALTSIQSKITVIDGQVTA